MTIRLIGLSGSLRGGSTNRKLLREAVRLFGEVDYTEADLDLPLYNGDNEDRDGVPEAVVTLARQIRDADAVLISTPEYNSGISGVMKNALDWISRTDVKPWSGKPVAVMSAAAGRAGGVRGQSMLRHCMTPFRVRLVPGPEIGVADARNQFDEDGRLISDLYQTSLGALMQALRREIDSGA